MKTGYVCSISVVTDRIVLLVAWVSLMRYIVSDGNDEWLCALFKDNIPTSCWRD
jgi:hypothetical protein